MGVASTFSDGVTLGEHNYPNAQSMMTFFQQLERRLRFGPGVSLVAITDSLPPLSEHNKTRFDAISVPGEAPFTRQTGAVVTYRLVSPAYFRALGIPIVQGRGFNEQELSWNDH